MATTMTTAVRKTSGSMMSPRGVGSDVTTSRDLTDFRNLFNCLVCVEGHTRPRSLACRHIFCESCLHAYRLLFGGIEGQGSGGLGGGGMLAGSPGTGEGRKGGGGGGGTLGSSGIELSELRGSSVACPICRKTTSISRDGVIGEEIHASDLFGVSNSSSASLGSCCRKVSLAAESTQRCDACIYRRRMETADYYCSKCSMNFCTGCRNIHDQHQLFQGHSVIHISNKDTFNLCCDIHGRLVCQFFCVDCDVPCCTICVLDEHKCHTSSKLREALASRRDVLKTLLNAFSPRLDRLEIKVKRLTRILSDENIRKRSNGGGGAWRGLTAASGARGSVQIGESQAFGGSGLIRSGRSSVSSLEDLLPDTPDSACDCRAHPLQDAVNWLHLGHDHAGAAEHRNGCGLVTGSEQLMKNGNGCGPVIQSNPPVTSGCLTTTPNCSSCKLRTPPYQNGTTTTTITNGGTLPSPLGAASPLVDLDPFSPIVVELRTTHTAWMRRLFDLATRLLELSQSKKLLAVYQDVVGRIQTVLDVEIKELQRGLDELIAHHQTLIALCPRPPLPSLAAASSSTSSSSVYSTHAHAAGGGESSGAAAAAGPSSSASSDAESSTCSTVSSGGTSRTRHSSGVSSASTSLLVANDDLDIDCPLPSMLVRPKLVWKVEKQRADLGELWNPCGAAFLPDNGLIVAEYDVTNDKNNKLRLFDAAGRSVTVLARGQIQPLGVSVTREGHVAATDCKGKRVKILTLAGQTIIDIGRGQFGWPYGIATNSRGQLVVTDAFSDCVSIYSVEGKRLKQFGGSGSGNVQFRNPYHIAIDSRDNVYVSDSGNNCIKVFDCNGRYMFTASETSIRRSSSDVTLTSASVSGAGASLAATTPLKRRKLKNPRGVAVDLKGNILVADDCCRVCMFHPTGRYVRNLLTDEDLVRYPEVVYCNSNGLLVVTEWNPNNMFAVKVFTLYEHASS